MKKSKIEIRIFVGDGYNIMLLMIDNYDSFTYNLVQYFQALGQTVVTLRNDALSVASIAELKPEAIIISPGPGRPSEAGICLEVMQHFAGKLPILGVCLGHQVIAQYYGGKIIGAEKIMHGKTSTIYHNNTGLFKGLPNPFSATRYHSLLIDKEALPANLTISAWTQNKEGGLHEIMGIQHNTLPIEGVQFHPESVLTAYGYELLRNFLRHGYIHTKTSDC